MLKKFIIILSIVMSICIVLFYLFVFYMMGVFEEKGGYRVEHVNSDVNPCKDEERFFYLYDIRTLRSYSFEDGTIQEHISLSVDNEWIYNYTVWEEDIYYVIVYYMAGKGRSNEYELRKLNYETGEETVLVTREDMLRLNGGETIRPYVQIYGGYILLKLSTRYVYMCPIDGDILTDSFDVNTLFPEEDQSGEIQQAVYDGIQVERYFDDGRYIIVGTRSQEGQEIWVDYYKDRSAYVEGQRVQFRRERYSGSLQYSLDGQRTWQPVTCLQEKIYEMSDIYEEYLTVEDGKIIGLLCVSKHPLESFNISASETRKDILFELDIETGESRILYDTRNNKTKIIGYREGAMYLVKAGKVYSQQLDGSERMALFNLPKDSKYSIDWQAGYMIVKAWNGGSQNEGELIEVYNTND